MASRQAMSWRATIATFIVYPLFGPACVALAIMIPLSLLGIVSMGPFGPLYYLYLAIWWLPAFYGVLWIPFLCAGIFAAAAGRLLARTSLAAALAAVSLGLLVSFGMAYLAIGVVAPMATGSPDLAVDFSSSPGTVLYILAASAACWYISRRLNRALARKSQAGPVNWTRGSWAEAGAACVCGAALAGMFAAFPQSTQAAWEECTDGSYRERIAGCTTIIERADTQSAERRATAHLRRGEAVRIVNYDDAAAMNDFAEAIRLDPQSAEAHALRGLAHARLGAHRETIADIDAAFDRSPTPLSDDPLGSDDDRLYRVRGEALLATGDIERAISDFSQEIAHAPRRARGHLNRAAAHLANGDEAGAMADFTEAIRFENYSEDGYIGRGSIYLARGELDLALADFDEAIRRRPKRRQTAPAFRMRGIVLERRGEEAGALAAYERALELDPDDAAAQAGADRVSGAR